MTLNDYFERIYCINLPHRYDRRKHCERVFDKLRWNVSLFSTSKGSDIPGGSHTALKLAHMFILSDALLKGYQNIMIFEDDILVSKDALIELQLFLMELPDDWELCYLGWMDWLDHHSDPISEHCQRVRLMNGAHAVGIRRSVMLECLRSQAQMDCHCDSAMARDIQSRGHAYAPRNNLVTQGCFGTDMIEDRPKILPAERLNEFV